MLHFFTPPNQSKVKSNIDTPTPCKRHKAKEKTKRKSTQSERKGARNNFTDIERERRINREKKRKKVKYRDGAKKNIEE